MKNRNFISRDRKGLYTISFLKIYDYEKWLLHYSHDKISIL